MMGAIIAGGVKPTPGTPRDTAGLNTTADWQGYAAFVQHTTNPGCAFYRGHLPKVTDGWQEEIGELFRGQGEDDGSQVYVGKRVQDPAAAVTPVLKSILFVATAMGGPSYAAFTADVAKSGVVDGPSSEGSAATKFWQVDGGSSLALALRRAGATSYSIEKRNGRHVSGSPQLINNYLSFKCALPRP